MTSCDLPTQPAAPAEGGAGAEQGQRTRNLAAGAGARAAQQHRASGRGELASGV